MNFLAALRFLTIIPISWKRGGDLSGLGCSIIYFPVVGVVIGLILAGLNWLLRLIFPTPLVNVLVLGFLAVITGALHLDGLADTCDGIVGHKTVEARWAVMHDSRVGGFGVVGVVCLLLVKYISLNSVPVPLLMVTLVLMPLISRWAMVYAIFAFPYARPEGLGKVFKREASWQRFTVATLITLILTMCLTYFLKIPYFYLVGFILIIGVWVITVFVAVYLRNRFAGLTGDTYGAINEVAEVCVLILVTLLTHNQWLGLA